MFLISGWNLSSWFHFFYIDVISVFFNKLGSVVSNLPLIEWKKNTQAELYKRVWGHSQNCFADHNIVINQHQLPLLATPSSGNLHLRQPSLLATLTSDNPYLWQLPLLATPTFGNPNFWQPQLLTTSISGSPHFWQPQLLATSTFGNPTSGNHRRSSSYPAPLIDVTNEDLNDQGIFLCAWSTRCLIFLNSSNFSIRLQCFHCLCQTFSVISLGCFVLHSKFTFYYSSSFAVSSCLVLRNSRKAYFKSVIAFSSVLSLTVEEDISIS